MAEVTKSKRASNEPIQRKTLNKKQPEVQAEVWGVHAIERRLKCHPLEMGVVVHPMSRMSMPQYYMCVWEEGKREVKRLEHQPPKKGDLKNNNALIYVLKGQAG